MLFRHAFQVLTKGLKNGQRVFVYGSCEHLCTVHKMPKVFKDGVRRALGLSLRQALAQKEFLGLLLAKRS
jgi:hypothetical protein